MGAKKSNSNENKVEDRKEITIKIEIVDPLEKTPQNNNSTQDQKFEYFLIWALKEWLHFLEGKQSKNPIKKFKVKREHQVLTINKIDLSRIPPRMEEVEKNEENPSLGIDKYDITLSGDHVVIWRPKEDYDEECVP